ncbi:MAG: DUF2877 domain-containing protein [Spirochaetes bacterium]|nr:DUF2877 domain-containing protein [Spirochaetota bacterium]
MNLRPSGGSLLLSLVSEAATTHPRAAVVPGARFDDWGLEPGDAGRFDGSAVCFAGAAPVVTLPRSRVLSREEAPLRSVVEPFPASARLGPLRAASAAVAALRSERHSEPSLPALLGADVPAGEGFPARFVRAARALETAVSARCVLIFLDAALGLAGFGPGLTPAGDDFLCGYFAGLRSRATDDADLDAFLNGWRAAALESDAGLLGRTNDISAGFLADAVEGRFGAALVSFADAALGATGEMDNTVAVLGDLGHGSGMDAAAGFLFAYRNEIGG